MVSALILQLCVAKVTDGLIAKKKKYIYIYIYISSQNYRHFARMFPAKLNYETIVDKGRSKSPLLLKMTPQEISEAPTRPAL